MATQADIENTRKQFQNSLIVSLKQCGLMDKLKDVPAMERRFFKKAGKQVGSAYKDIVKRGLSGLILQDRIKKYKARLPTLLQQAKEHKLDEMWKKWQQVENFLANPRQLLEAQTPEEEVEKLQKLYTKISQLHKNHIELVSAAKEMNPNQALEEFCSSVQKISAEKLIETGKCVAGLLGPMIEHPSILSARKRASQAAAAAAALPQPIRMTAQALPTPPPNPGIAGNVSSLPTPPLTPNAQTSTPKTVTPTQTSTLNPTYGTPMRFPGSTGIGVNMNHTNMAPQQVSNQNVASSSTVRNMMPAAVSITQGGAATSVPLTNKMMHVQAPVQQAKPQAPPTLQSQPIGATNLAAQPGVFLAQLGQNPSYLTLQQQQLQQQQQRQMLLAEANKAKSLAQAEAERTQAQHAQFHQTLAFVKTFVVEEIKMAKAQLELTTLTASEMTLTPQGAWVMKIQISKINPLLIVQIPGTYVVNPQAEVMFTLDKGSSIFNNKTHIPKIKQRLMENIRATGQVIRIRELINQLDIVIKDIYRKQKEKNAKKAAARQQS
eukprot:CAMPEP_0184483892 /NCGR_PEP_ID=MMETSP0113_2-20130426/5568_1 /TAXON_ID=91329 /ORGANISM="Norrisiella sphaerica, Strain BC52" /LENGTH=547 /DNA_ID=CAMNT_0026864559 /DNA_START=68 /DNA_END=1711 /DNA_ORIENTATION=+